jgi:hypothetical protein
MAPETESTSMNVCSELANSACSAVAFSRSAGWQFAHAMQIKS